MPDGAQCHYHVKLSAAEAHSTMQFAPAGVRDPARLLFFGMLTAAVLYALPSALQLGAHDHDEMGNLERAATASGLHLRQQHRRSLSHHNDHGGAATAGIQVGDAASAGLHGAAHPGSGHWRPHAGDRLYNSPLAQAAPHTLPASSVSSESHFHIQWQTVPGTELPRESVGQRGAVGQTQSGADTGNGNGAFPIGAMPVPRPGPAGTNGMAGSDADTGTTVSAAVIPPVPLAPQAAVQADSEAAGATAAAAAAAETDPQSVPEPEPESASEAEPPILPVPGTLSMRDLDRKSVV